MDTEALIRRYFDAVNGEDWSALESVWHPDGEMRAVGVRPLVGRTAVLAYFKRLFTPWQHHHDEPTRIGIAGDAAFANVTFTGTTPEGVAVTFEAVDIFDIDAGGNTSIRRLSNWYDLVYVREQLAAAAS